MQKCAEFELHVVGFWVGIEILAGFEAIIIKDNMIIIFRKYIWLYLIYRFCVYFSGEFLSYKKALLIKPV